MEKQIAENAEHTEQHTQALKILREQFAFLQREVLVGIRVTSHCYLGNRSLVIHPVPIISLA